MQELKTIKKSEPVLVRAEVESNNGFYFLSNLDQQIATIVQTVYCFKADEETQNKIESASEVIKEALAKVLVHFYPLTGSLMIGSDGRLVVKCTNNGVPFVEAVVDSNVEVLGDITEPDPDKLGMLVHTKFREADDTLELPLLTVQVTRFKCGSFTLGIAINHCMTDGISAMEFVNSWAEIARGLSLTTPPFLDRSILRSRQPPKIGFAHEGFIVINDVSNMDSLYEDEQLLYNSFDFDLHKLAKLKKIAMEDGIIKNCTSFEVLSALVWRARSKALNMKAHQQAKLLFLVDGRSRFNPPFPKGYFGNAIIEMFCLCTAGDLIEKPLSFAIKLIQDAIKLATEDYIRSFLDYYEVKRPKMSIAHTLTISSWTRLAFNTANFGWGEPTQAGPVNIPKEVALLIPQGKEKNMRLLLGLPISAMKTFEEFIQV